MPSVLLALLLGGAVFVLRKESAFQFSLIDFALTEVVALTMFLAISRNLGSTWLSYFTRLLVGGVFSAAKQ